MGGIVAALVLVGGGVALTLTRDDEPTTAEDVPTAPTGTPELENPSPEAPQAPTSPAVPETAAPSEPTPAPSPPATPDTSGPITGDIDGDGLGDVAIGVISSGLRIFPSDGSTFAKPVDRRQDGFVALSGDVDADGTNDVVTITGEVPDLEASTDGATSSSVITTAEPLGYSSIFDVDLALGDVDGDGALDLVTGVRVADDRLQLDVATGDGKGGFARTTTWFEDDLIDGALAVADVDGDGLSDLVHFQNGLRDDTEAMGTLLRSTGSAFEVTGESFAVDVGGFALSGGLRGGDIDGDGTDEIVAATGYGPKINVWEWTGSGFDQVPYYDNSDTVESNGPWQQAVVTDVNGDGFDDVAQLALRDDNSPEIRVFVSDGTTLTPDPAWTTPLRIGTSSYTLVDSEIFRQGS